MDRQEAKSWLNRGWRLNQEIDALERVKRETFLALTSGAQSPDATPTSGTKDPHKLDNYAILAALLDNRVDELVALKAEILRGISKVDDSRHRTLLIDRYVRFLTWEDISREMHYCFRQVTRLHGEALDAFAEKMS